MLRFIQLKINELFIQNRQNQNRNSIEPNYHILPFIFIPDFVVVVVVVAAAVTDVCTWSR